MIAVLDYWRRRLPLAWWLVYDAVVALVILVGVSTSDPLFFVGIGWLAVAALIDLVEFVAKRRLARAPHTATENEHRR